MRGAVRETPRATRNVGMSPTALRTRVVRPEKQLKQLKLDMSHWRLLRYEIFMRLIAKGEIKVQWVNGFIESSRSSGMCQAIYH